MPSNAQELEPSQSLWWNQPVVYWQANQVVITFHSPIQMSGLKRSEFFALVIESLKLDHLDQFLSTKNFQLRPFTTKDVPHQVKSPQEEKSWEELEQLEEELERIKAEAALLERVRVPFSSLLTSNDQPYKTPGQRDLEELEARVKELEGEIKKRQRILSQHNNTSTEDGPESEEGRVSGLNSTVGKYFFASHTGQGTLATCFFHISNPALASTSSSYGHSSVNPTNSDMTHDLVTFLNHSLDTLSREGNIPILAAMPNWIGGVNSISQSCPAAPPLPITGDNTAFKNWHFELPQLSSTLKELNGNGATVFVLDTIPTVKRIMTAAKNAKDHNAQLQDFVAAMNSNPPEIVIDHLSLPKRLTNIQAGKDLHGQLYGFQMPDHGLFVSGIIHDLAPKAKIECVRVLNDSGVGDVGTLCHVLQAIQDRMQQEDLGQVVINLSLEITPPDAHLPAIWFGNDCCLQPQDLLTISQDITLLRLGLRMIIKSLAAQGAVIVAASGNESNTNNHPPQRFGPRYPAAFPEVISVGAVDNKGQATTYSDYPSLPPEDNGIATYGGAIPQTVPPATSQISEPMPAGAKTWAVVNDAIVGIYSSTHYPMLLANDEPPNQYSAPPSSYCWAYWSGTSFAAPIISALAARILQGQLKGDLPASMPVKNMITTAQGQQLITTNGSALPTNTGFGAGIGLLQANQTPS